MPCATSRPNRANCNRASSSDPRPLGDVVNPKMASGECRDPQGNIRRGTSVGEHPIRTPVIFGNSWGTSFWPTTTFEFTKFYHLIIHRHHRIIVIRVGQKVSSERLLTTDLHTLIGFLPRCYRPVAVRGWRVRGTGQGSATVKSV